MCGIVRKNSADLLRTTIQHQEGFPLVAVLKQQLDRASIGIPQHCPETDATSPVADTLIDQAEGIGPFRMKDSKTVLRDNSNEGLQHWSFIARSEQAIQLPHTSNTATALESANTSSPNTWTIAACCWSGNRCR